MSGDEEHPLFTFACVDWYRTNGTEFWAHDEVAGHSAVFNGGVTYRPKTDGTRNDCFERIFLTVSPRFEEVLPTVDNPVSPWKDVTGTRLYRNNGFCSNREGPDVYLQRSKDIARYGIRKAIVTNHESGWSDYWYESSHTMRTRAARLKGGDHTARDLTRRMQELGFRWGSFVKQPRLAADGAVVAIRRDDDTIEVIPVECKEWVGVSCEARRAAAVALDQAGDPIGPAETRLSRGLVYIVPLANAFSYLLRPGEPVHKPLTGEQVLVQGERTHEVVIPPVSRPGARVWFQREGQWIDFVASPLVRAHLAVRGEILALNITNNLRHPAAFAIEFDGQPWPEVEIAPEDAFEEEIPVSPRGTESLRPVELVVRMGQAQQRETWWLHETYENGEWQLILHESPDVHYPTNPNFAGPLHTDIHFVLAQ